MGVAGGEAIARGAARRDWRCPMWGRFGSAPRRCLWPCALLGAITIGGGVGVGSGASRWRGLGWRIPICGCEPPQPVAAELIERRAPLVLDLVAATVGAGIDLDAAITRCDPGGSGPLREELERVQANIALGRPRRDELRDAAVRTDSPSLAALAMAVSLSDRLGVPLAETLESQARRTRGDRGRAVQERAAAAGPKVLIVVVFVLVPAALMPLLAAVALSVAGDSRRRRVVTLSTRRAAHRSRVGHVWSRA